MYFNDLNKKLKLVIRWPKSTFKNMIHIFAKSWKNLKIVGIQFISNKLEFLLVSCYTPKKANIIINENL